MNSFLLNNKPLIQFTIFVFLLLFMILFEGLFARRPFQYSRWVRGFSNVGIAVFNNIGITLFMPMLAMGASYFARSYDWGLFYTLNWPPLFELILGLLFLDLIIYAQHIAFHRIPILWRLHRVHHADLELDVTSGIRFHTIEIAISMGIKIGAILALGVSPMTVLIFEILLMSTSMFHHSNIKLPLSIDKFLRFIIITPDVHRVHHSIYVNETNSNYGFNFPWWDRIFKTYHAQPKDGHVEMKLGIQLFRQPKWLYFHRLLIEPFVNHD